MPPANSPDIAKKFGLESVPESVKRLAQLIAKRDASIDDLAAIISQDKDLKTRLLRAANPGAASEEDYIASTVEEALQRTGMSSALLVAMSAPLIHAVKKTFLTMLAVDLQPLEPGVLDPFEDEHTLGEVTFAGKATGVVHLRLPLDSVPFIGERLLGLTAEDVADPAVANDIVGELCNMVAGNFQSNLCDAGLECKLTPPRIARTDAFKLHRTPGGTSERYSFKSADLAFFADLSVNAWGE
jgi:chemotaxis protein CheX